MPSTSPWLAIILAALAAIGPFAIDAYLPAFPAMAAALGATQIEVQQTLTAYMSTFAVMVLWHGALSDRFGRRAVLIASTVIFSVASVLCALAQSIEWLWLGRALQGLCGGAGMVVGRAVVRDVYDGAHAQRLMSRVMTIFAVAPALAPIVGGGLLALAGWRSIFFFLALFGAALTWMCWRYLPETLPREARQPLHPVGLARAYGKVLTHPAFLLIAGAGALNFNAFFIYVLSAPVFVMTHLGLGYGEFGWLFIPTVGGMMLGSVLSGRMAGRWSPRRCIAVGFAIMLAAAAANVLCAVLLPAGLPWSVVPLPLFTFGMALAMPAFSLLALNHFPERRGMVSSCQSFVQVGLNAVTAGLIAPAMWGSVLGLATGMSLFLSLSLMTFLAAGPSQGQKRPPGGQRSA
ncbi:Bcr/CflA family drug resistance efflux transporter [Azoarcus sp. DD4]|uniref:multidrug effflux MFS transporter n=1 Tax=Azoarcus sp. DD4 TaxID=2027405 RepID=UPI00112EC210|nr:multidrug effflux MFS transporter [Azoarcus sp. DD4]QDF99161.1 Bcr/CflA family drug resistance efflux transporter [Azoarcus sp. DD4]